MQSNVTQGSTVYAFIDLDEDPVETNAADHEANIAYIDTDSGEFYEKVAVPGDDANDGEWVVRGKVVPFVGDQAAPAAVAGLAVTPVTIEPTADENTGDGATVAGFDVTWTEGDEDDLIGYTIQYDETGTDWSQPVNVDVGLTGSTLVQQYIIAGESYDFRIAARDAEGFRSAWSSTVTAIASGDTTAPEVPSGLFVTAGFRLLGLRWDKNEERDLAFYQVRYYTTAGGAGEAQYIRTLSSFIIVKDLTPDVEYTVEVRAIDRSGNVATSASDLTGVNFAENDETGWSDAETGTPTLIGAGDVAFNSVLTAMLSANLIDADDIKAGTLSLGGPSQAGSIEVYSSGGILVAELGNRGFLLFNPNNETQAMWLTAGSIWFTAAWDGDVDTTEWTAGMTPEGINASAITFGVGQGGANSIPNAGFELAAFAVITEATWNTSAGTPSWDDATSAVNLNTAGATLTMTSV